jgi:single-stranded-DNA-specific exonuclease
MENNVLEQLKNILDEDEIKINEPLSKHTTYKIGGIADYFVMPTNIEKIKELTEKLNIDESIVRILVNRGIDNLKDIEEFLNPSLDNLYDPFLLNDMDKAVERINTAVKNKEKIYIYGDYDVDGVTASSIVYISLKEIYDNVYIYIPERENEGYGLNTKAIDKIYKDNGNLIITVDCGISAHSEAEYAKSLGIDMIITDHHTCPEVLPSCVAVINPKRNDSTYPFSELCGAGVALKLCSALNLLSEKIIAICAVGTVADIVPLILENRIITYYGIKLLREGILENINILCSVAGIDVKNITTTTIGFTISPRINAAGRMATAKEAVEFFVSKDIKRI